MEVVQPGAAVQAQAVPGAAVDRICGSRAALAEERVVVAAVQARVAALVEVVGVQGADPDQAARVAWDMGREEDPEQVVRVA